MMNQAGIRLTTNIANIEAAVYAAQHKFQEAHPIKQSQLELLANNIRSKQSQIEALCIQSNYTTIQAEYRILKKLITDLNKLEKEYTKIREQKVKYQERIQQKIVVPLQEKTLTGINPDEVNIKITTLEAILEDIDSECIRLLDSISVIKQMYFDIEEKIKAATLPQKMQDARKQAGNLITTLAEIRTQLDKSTTKELDSELAEINSLLHDLQLSANSSAAEEPKPRYKPGS